MKNSYKILQILLTIILCVLFGFVTYFALENKIVKADTNTNLVNLQYSNNWSTSGMPDYNKFISNNFQNSFYNVNTNRNLSYNYTFSFENYVVNGDTRNYIMLAYFDYYFANNSDAQQAYNYFNGLAPNIEYSSWSHGICSFGYFTTDDIVFYARVRVLPILENNRVYLRILTLQDKLRISDNSLNIDYSFNSNRHVITINNIPFDKREFEIYSRNLSNKPLSIDGGSIPYDDIWGYSSMREDYFTINYDVFSYYYFNYGDIELFSNCYWNGNSNVYNLTFNNSSKDNIVISPNKNYGLFGWHADTGIILSKIDFSSGGNWVSYKQIGSAEFYSYLKFNYYVNQNLINSFNGTNSNYDSTYLYRQDVQWYDIFGHLYNFMIYLLFDMPLISNITKPIYMLISGTTTTFNWLAGCVAGLGIFGAFAMCYLLFAIIKRFL